MKKELLRLRIEFYETPEGKTRGEVVTVSDPSSMINHRKEYNSPQEAIQEAIDLLEVFYGIFQSQREGKSEEEIILQIKNSKRS